MSPNRFTHFLAIDWSGAKGARQKGIALSLAEGAGSAPVLVEPPRGGWAREDVLAILRDDIPRDTLVGMDLGISLPFQDAGAFFPHWSDSPKDAKSLWALIDQVCSDDPNLECGSFVSHPQLSEFPPFQRTSRTAFSLGRRPHQARSLSMRRTGSARARCTPGQQFQPCWRRAGRQIISDRHANAAPIARCRRGLADRSAAR